MVSLTFSVHLQGEGARVYLRDREMVSHEEEFVRSVVVVEQHLRWRFGVERFERVDVKDGRPDWVPGERVVLINSRLLQKHGCHLWVRLHYSKHQCQG